MAEIWDLVDKDGKQVGIQWPRADHDNIPEGLYHPCVEVWVRVGDRLLVAHRHPDKSEGLKYDAPGGAVLAGESIPDGAVRELAEEVFSAGSKESIPVLFSALVRRDDLDMELVNELEAILNEKRKEIDNKKPYYPI